MEELDELKQEIAELRNSLDALKVSLAENLFNPIQDEYEKNVYNDGLKEFSDKYSERLKPFEAKLKSIEGPDFDIVKQSFDGVVGRNDISQDDYVDALVNKIDEQLKPIADAFGVKPEEVESVTVETTDGETKEANVEDGKVESVATDDEDSFAKWQKIYDETYGSNDDEQKK